MAGKQLGDAVKQFQRLFNVGTTSGLTDDQLLARFSTQSDDAAFEALLERHGPMVLSVCRGVLADPNNAQDAFQATFLVLVRKARSIRPGRRWEAGSTGWPSTCRSRSTPRPPGASEWRGGRGRWRLR